MLSRVAECKEIIDRKNKGLLTGDILKIVDDEFIKDIRDEAAILRNMCLRIDNLKIEYQVR